MIIGMGVVQRLEYFTDEVPNFYNPDNIYKRWSEEDSIRSFQINDATRETQQLFHWQYMEVNVLFNLLQLHDYLSHNNKNFIIHNLGFNFDIDNDFVFANKIYEQIQSRPRFINMFENSLHQIMQDNNLTPWDHDQYGWHGHPDEKGHAAYADYLADYVDKYLSSL
jgi:lysophospholipase L1-like esterase